MMRIIERVFFGTKCAYLTLVRSPPCMEFCNVAIAFPRVLIDGVEYHIGYDTFRKLLSVGNAISVEWSKIDNAYVAQFEQEDFPPVCDSFKFLT